VFLLILKDQNNGMVIVMSQILLISAQTFNRNLNIMLTSVK